MGWNSVAPHLGGWKKDQVRVGVMQIAGGSPKLSVTLSTAVFEKLGEPDQCNIFAGDGDDAGKILVQFDADGAHAIHVMTKGGGRILAHIPPGAPSAKRKPVPSAYDESDSEDGVKLLTITLPW